MNIYIHIYLDFVYVCIYWQRGYRRAEQKHRKFPHIYIYLHIYIYIMIYISIFLHMQTYVYTWYIYLYVYTIYIHIYIYTYIHIHIYVCIEDYIYIYIFICVCMYITPCWQRGHHQAKQNHRACFPKYLSHPSVSATCMYICLRVNVWIYTCNV